MMEMGGGKVQVIRDNACSRKGYGFLHSWPLFFV